MRFLEQPYYVGLLSAAATHGAAHQQPMVFQVVTDRPTRPARAGRVRIEFHMSRQVETAPVVEVQTGDLLDLLGEHDLAAHLAVWLEIRRFRGFGWRGGAGRRGAPGSAVAGGSQRARGGRGLIPRAHVTAWRADHERPKG